MLLPSPVPYGTPPGHHDLDGCGRETLWLGSNDEMRFSGAGILLARSCVDPLKKKKEQKAQFLKLGFPFVG
jgi:hypothetical protein